MKAYTTKTRKSIIAILCGVFALCLCAFAFTAITPVRAIWMDGGNGNSYYSDMTADGEDLEYYDTLYNADWQKMYLSTPQGTLEDSWAIQDDTFLSFTPSENNTTGSFIWKFDYTVTKVGGNMNVYPLSSKPWSGATQVEIGQYFTEEGKTYTVEIGSIKIKSDATQYWVYLKVDGEFKIGTYRTPASEQHRGLYFYLAGENHGEGVLDSVKPTPVEYDKLTNGDWNWWVSSYNDAGNKGVLPEEWKIVNDSYLKFTPSAGNTSKSFSWKFYYKPVVSGNVLIYPLSIGMWGGTHFIDLAEYGFENGKVYQLELKIVQSKTDVTKYHEYLIIDGTEKDLGEKTLAKEGENGSDPTGLYIYLTNAATDCMIYENDPTVTPEPENNLTDIFDELDNTDWIKLNGSSAEEGTLPSEWTIENDKVLRFTPSAANKTGSFVWKFNYIPSAAGIINLYVLSKGSWDGADPKDIGAFFTEVDKTYAVELSVRKVKNSEQFNFMLKVDGVLKIDENITPKSEQHRELYFYVTTGAGVIKSLNVVEESNYESYDILYNTDWIKLNGSSVEEGVLPATWTLEDDKVLRFTPSESNTSGSFLWKFNYIPSAAGTINLYVLCKGSWDGANPKDIGAFFTEIGKTYAVELGVRKIKDSEQFNFMIKVDGVLKIDENITPKSEQHRELYFYVTTGAGVVDTEGFTYSIKDNAGAVLDEGTLKAGQSVSFNSSSLTDGTKVFVGFVYNGKLYKTLEEVFAAKVSEKMEIVARTVDLSLENGAYIKLVSGGNASIKFNAYIDKSDAEDFVSDFGLLLAGYPYTKHLNFTHEGLSGNEEYYREVKKSEGMRYTENSGDTSEYYFGIFLNSISLGNYGMEYAARAYVTVTYADGTTKNVYTPFDEANNVRSVYEVASLATEDPSQAENLTLLKRYVNGVIELDKNFDLIGKDRDYTVSVSAASGGYYVVTVTANEGFDLSGIGAIYVAGEKISVTEASMNSDKTIGTFKIAESDVSALTIENFEESVKELSSSEKKLEIFAYEGPKAGIRFDANGSAGYAGGTATLAVLEEYMAAGFTHWSVSDASYGNHYIDLQGGGFKAKGTGITNTNYDVFWALDLAAEYAAKYKKSCPVYVLIPGLATLSGTEAIGAAYDELTSYVDANGGKYSPVNGKSQLAGFILKDEPTWSEYDAFAAVFNYIAYEKGAINAGYGFECALLQTYTASENVNNNYKAYVEKYAKLFKDTAISFDNYPCNYTPSYRGWFSSQSESWSLEQSWFSDMQTIRSQENKVYGTCIQAYTAGRANNKSPYKKLTYESEISMQVYTALAYGFTRLNYFTYWQRDTDLYYAQLGRQTEVLQDSMIRWNDYNDWTKGYTYSDLYNWGKNANAEAAKLAEILMKFDNVGVQLVQGTTSQMDFTGANTTNVTNAVNVSSNGALVVGGFTCGSYNGYLATNVTLPHDGFTATSTFALGAQYDKAIVYVNGEPVVYKLESGNLTIAIPSGEGVFIVPIEA